MNATWGVYKTQGRLKGGKETTGSDRKAVSFFVRWRVDGAKRRRSFKTRGHANTFYDELLKAKLLGWAADDKGWPIDPQVAAVQVPVVVAPAPVLAAHTFETYVDQAWWPTASTNMKPKNRLGHERNARVAVQLLRLKDGDRRVGFDGADVGDSIPLPLLDADDVKAALVARRRINGRTAAANQRRIDAARGQVGDETVEVTLAPEVASDATVRAFKITLGMILAAASASGHVVGDPMKGTAAVAGNSRETPPAERAPGAGRTRPLPRLLLGHPSHKAADQWDDRVCCTSKAVLTGPVDPTRTGWRLRRRCGLR